MQASTYKNQHLKAVVILLLILSWSSNYAQSPTATEQEIQQALTQSQGKSIWESFYMSFGLGLIDSPKINEVLAQQEMAEIDETGILIGVGFSFRLSDEDFLDLEMNLNSSSNREENFGNSFSELGIHLHYHREILQLEDAYSFSIGAQASYADVNIDLYNRQQEFDLSNLEFPGNRIELNYPAFRLGPSFTFNWKDPNSGKVFMKIQMQYEFNIYSSNWKINDAQLNNSFNERLNRFNLKLILPLL
ncbi:MAG: hypothetical protein LAT51_11130 [Flavobacteriaceae bacterium]|nr:hypothetical protein [Flavobacteriaceae bacterium]